MRGMWKQLPAHFVVAGLGTLYLVLTTLRPSPYLAILLGMAVVAAAQAWDRWGSIGSALLAIPALFYAWLRVSKSDIVASMGDHSPFVVAWIGRGYMLIWLALALLAWYVCRLSHRTRELEAASAHLRHVEQQLTALHKIALSLSTTLDVSRLLEIILEQLGQLWGYDHGAILLYDKETNDLVIAAARDYARPLGERFAADQGICGQVFQSGQPMLVGDVKQDARYIEGIPGARSELAVPLIWEGKTLGVLNVESQSPHAYCQTDVDLLSTVAEQAAASIGNARLHQETRDLAITDPHTGLFNYRHFQDQLAVAVRESQLMATPASLLMLDLDFFKRCNDTYGHPTGDAVLQQLARVLRDSTRAHDQVFRYGGEEFAVILPGTSEEAAVRVAERIRERVAAYGFITRSGRRLDFPITVSIGVSCYPKDGLTHVDLLIAADKSLYAAKAGGRNRVVAASSGVHAEPA
ncbi:MAG TPA: sensor domain-containing diguanylate cyclase [Symbiobacteriaceae bacterium]|nr:sensor domain-containing diguanylate cyclase [Symbiobacteriaceae bacterium]